MDIVMSGVSKWILQGLESVSGQCCAWSQRTLQCLGVSERTLLWLESVR